MSETPRQSLDVDIVCVGFGPAVGGFLTTLSGELTDAQGMPRLESRAMPGMPLQILCYERADDLGFGVSGVVTRGQALRTSFPDLDPADIPLAHAVTREDILYLQDPVGASRRGLGLRTVDSLLRAIRPVLPYADHALRLPYIPDFLRKEGGLVLSIGQFNQWVASRLMSTGLVQLWPGTPVAGPLIDGNAVVGVRLVDQGTDRHGQPAAGYMPGMDIRATLTVVGDGPVGPVGRQLDAHLGLPPGHHQREWAVGMKMVVDLSPDCELTPGTVLHTLGYPEPEIFGFVYVHADRVASIGIFVPSWLDSPVRCGYRYLQHWMQHPALWRHLQGGTLRSWGARTLQESGMRGEPYLVGDGYARIGEGSGTTNVLTGSGVDEAWATGVQLAEAVVELLQAGEPLNRQQLERTYVERRRGSWVETEARRAANARNGFQRGFVTGLAGMGVTGLTRGALGLADRSQPVHTRVPTPEEYYRGKLTPAEVLRVRQEAASRGEPLHDALMQRAGWPQIPYDGKLLLSQQDAMLIGGKVQAPPGYADHVIFVDPSLCERCDNRLCIEACSGQAILPGDEGSPPRFERDKCVHCGACVWNCTRARSPGEERTNIEFQAGAGGLHSAEN